jgi:hypothetical protein
MYKLAFFQCFMDARLRGDDAQTVFDLPKHAYTTCPATQPEAQAH